LKLWPESLIWRLSLWAFLLFLISIPILWLAFSKGADQVSRNVVDTQILDFATQLRGYRASAVNAAALGRQPDGLAISLPVLVGDSDWVWQFSRNGAIEAQSDLLQLSAFDLPAEAAPMIDAFLLQTIDTPAGRFRVAGRAVDEGPDGEAAQVVRYIVGLSEDIYTSRVQEHAARLQDLVLFAVLPISVGILGMLTFVVLTLRATFTRLNSALEQYEKAGEASIDGHFPREIAELVDRTNAILRQNQLLIERTRKYVSKIAHDINHPLAILGNLAREGFDRDQVNRQIERMSGLVDRYASLARAIGPEGPAQRLTAVSPVLQDIVDGFAIVYRRTPLTLSFECPETLQTMVPRHDLETMISNLVSNAHKYAESTTRITAGATENGLTVTVEDDGPGIPAADRDRALNWGGRLDEAPPGTGFGLSIVCDIADLYSGSVHLDGSEDLGGLKVVIALPVSVSA